MTKKILEEIGFLLHKARSGRLIIKLRKEVRPGALVYDEKGKTIGKVVELIGPIRSPYASVIQLTEKNLKEGKKIYRD